MNSSDGASLNKSWAELAEEEEEQNKSQENGKDNTKEIENKLSTLSTDSGADPDDVDDPLPIKTTGQGLRPDESQGKLLVDQTDPTSPLYSVNNFEELGLKPELLKGVYGMGFNRPSRIQEISLPVILGEPKRNLIAQAQSGTGKTAAFTLGMLSKINSQQQTTQAICLCPARELARQIFDVVSEMGKFTDIKPLLAVPDAPIPKSHIPNQVVIGTPGKLNDLIKRRQIDTRYVRILVFDEADVMLDTQGLSSQSLRLKSALPQKGQNCQILLFSATYSDEIDAFARKVVPEPFVSIKLKKEELTLEKIAQLYIDCKDETQKFSVLSEIYCYISVGQSIIFVAKRSTGQDLMRKMMAEGHTVSLLHGADMAADQRDRVMDDFRNGKTKVLITTNVLSRGIDILQVTLVINYDLPLTRNGDPDFSTYLHRIGRSGRFGRSGIAVNLVHDDSSKRQLNKIQEYFKRDIQQFAIEDIPKLDPMLRELN